MIAMEYIDMISRMTMTASATHPRFFTISVMVKALCRSSPALAASWNRKAKKPRALLPRMLNRIVTVEILQRVFVSDGRCASPFRKGRERPAAKPPETESGRPAAGRAPRPVLLKHEVVRDNARDLHRLPREQRRREPRVARGRDRRLLQERVARDGRG